MKRNLLICSGIIALLATTLQAAPIIQANDSSFHFETVTSGDLVHHDFTIRNTGDSVLVISNVLTSCGCTTAKNWTANINPGTTGSIPVIFNSFNYSGEVTKMATVLSNDPKQPAIILRLNGNVFKPITVQPPFVLMALTVEQTGQGEATISNQTTNAIRVKEIRSSNPAFTTSLRTNTPGFNYTLFVSAKPPYPQGYQTAVRIFTDDGRELSFLALANAPATIQQH